VSTTDPDARVTKMPDGGLRPAFNVQLATTTDAARAIVGVSVTNRGSDQGQATHARTDRGRTGVRPTELLVDGGYPSHDAIDQAAAAGVTLYAPVPKPRARRPRRQIHHRSTLICPSLATATPSPPGASAWAPTTPSRSTSSAPRPQRR